MYWWRYRSTRLRARLQERTVHGRCCSRRRPSRRSLSLPVRVDSRNRSSTFLDSPHHLVVHFLLDDLRIASSTRLPLQLLVRKGYELDIATDKILWRARAAIALIPWTIPRGAVALILWARRAISDARTVAAMGEALLHDASLGLHVAGLRLVVRRHDGPPMA